MKSRCVGFMLFFNMYRFKRAVSSFDIFMGGLALHPFALVGVMVFVSGWKSFTLNPFGCPVTSTGLNPVCTLTFIINAVLVFADAINILHFSVDGGCIVFSSILYVGGSSHWILCTLQYFLYADTSCLFHRLEAGCPFLLVYLDMANSISMLSFRSALFANSFNALMYVFMVLGALAFLSR